MKHGKEVKPDLHMVLQDLLILRSAAELLGEPIYLLGDDAKDYFSQIRTSSEDWHKLCIAFLDFGDQLYRGGRARFGPDPTPAQLGMLRRTGRRLCKGGAAAV